LGVIVLAVAAFFAGPSNEFGSDTPTSRAAPPSSSTELDAWLAQSESQFTGIKPGTAKGIVWANDTHQKTPWAVVYLHGFSASRLETAPVADHVAKQLGANLFYTRLSGHGLPGKAMGQVTRRKIGWRTPWKLFGLDTLWVKKCWLSVALQVQHSQHGLAPPKTPIWFKRMCLFLPISD
jgi:hypothetical protein